MVASMADVAAMAKANCSRTSATDPQLKTVLCVLAWFALNITMATVTKSLFLYGRICSEGFPCSSFEFPLTMTAFDVIVGRWLSGIYLRFYSRSEPRHLSLREQLREIAPMGACFGVSVGLGNLSLKYIYPSFNQMIGASSPLITVLVAVATGVRFNAWTWLSVPVISGGIVACVTQEVHVHFLGAASCVGAAVFRAVKTVLQARLLSCERKLDSVELLYYMSPYAALILFAFASAVEGAEPVLMTCWRPLFAPATKGWTMVVCLLSLTALNAWCLSISNFLVTYYTSPVTLQVLGNVKTCLSIGVSVVIFRNPLHLSQCVGVAACLFGVWLYGRKGKVLTAQPNGVTKEKVG